MAGGADAILIPEQPFDLDAGCDHLRRRHASRSSFSIVVVAEGAVPKEGTLELPESPLDENGFPRLGGLANHLAPEIEKRTGFQTRVTILGHLQRGGSPVAFDRVLGTRFGIAAADLAAAGGWGRMVASEGAGRRGRDARGGRRASGTCSHPSCTAKPRSSSARRPRPGGSRSTHAHRHPHGRGRRPRAERLHQGRDQSRRR